jgi:hypothetical protein
MEDLIATQKGPGETLRKRVSDLVGAVRDLIERIPPENLR